MALMTKEESYAERRQLFKNIWETAMQIDEKDADIMTKPKVIKTLRLDEVDRCVIGKGKKERIRNLRTVCKKILDFCDRQDADDVYYKQIAEGKEPVRHKSDFKSRKIKTHRARKKFKKTKSLSAPRNTEKDQAKATTSERKDEIAGNLTNSSRDVSPMKINRTACVRRTITRHKTSKVKSVPDNMEVTNDTGKEITRRKIVRKKRSKRKKQLVPHVSPPRPSGTFVRPKL